MLKARSPIALPQCPPRVAVLDPDGIRCSSYAVGSWDGTAPPSKQDATNQPQATSVVFVTGDPAVGSSSRGAER